MSDVFTTIMAQQWHFESCDTTTEATGWCIGTIIASFCPQNMQHFIFVPLD